MMPTHIIKMDADKATLSKRLIGLATTLFPARMFCATGIIRTINANDNTHNKPNNTVESGIFCMVIVLNVNWRSANGSTMIKLIIAAVFRFEMMFFIESSFCRTSRISKSPYLKMMLQFKEFVYRRIEFNDSRPTPSITRPALHPQRNNKTALAGLSACLC